MAGRPHIARAVRLQNAQWQDERVTMLRGLLEQELKTLHDRLVELDPGMGLNGVSGKMMWKHQSWAIGVHDWLEEMFPTDASTAPSSCEEPAEGEGPAAAAAGP